VLLPPGDEGRPDPLPLATLDGRAIVMSMTGFEAIRTALGAAMQEAGGVLRPSVLTRHREAIVPLVRSGTGIAFTNGRYAEIAASAGVVTRRLDPPIACDFGLLHREGSLSPAARGFVGVLARELGIQDGAGAGHSQAL
jgi:DNA-binding transcriptional LysR family regulator